MSIEEEDWPTDWVEVVGFPWHEVLSGGELKYWECHWCWSSAAIGVDKLVCWDIDISFVQDESTSIGPSNSKHRTVDEGLHCSN